MVKPMIYKLVTLTLSLTPIVNQTVNESERKSDMNTDKMELVLSTIDQLGVVSVKQLHEILKFSSYRKTCRIVQNLEPYLHVERSRQKIVYLNKEGRQFVGSDREVKKSPLFEHRLLINEVFIHYNCPVTWRTEHTIEIEEKGENMGFIKVEGLKPVTKKKIVCDAYFERNGYTYLIEVDNTRKMVDNRKKIQKYLYMWLEIRKQYQNPKLCIFTKSQIRKKEFSKLLKNIPNEIYCFDEL